MGLRRTPEADIEPGETVSVVVRDCPDLSIVAKVTYVGAARIGLNFQRVPLSDQELSRVYLSAPRWQRLSVWVKRSAWSGGRRLAVFTANTLLRALILKWVRPRFIFAAYGTQRQAATYYSPSLARFMPLNLILGYIRHQDMRGLMVAPQYLEHELQSEPPKVRHYIEQLQRDFRGAERIALVGRLPNFVKKAEIEIDSPLVEGSRGTRFMLWDVARALRRRPQYLEHDSIVVLGGAGRIGSAVCRDIARLYAKVLAFDPRYTEEEEVETGDGILLRTANPERLADQRLYIALTQNGDEVLELGPYIPSGSLIADDTHPCIDFDARTELEQHGISVEKTVLSHNEFSMWPRMPAWNNRDIPGCLVEALVLLHHPELTDNDFIAFCHEAERLGFAGRLVEPLDD
ncbi:hypothetical protein GCM10007392_05500 [Saccharospirillum salsuginis]|uniref:Uncharacterized protein n=2 Tax=Saccharospirillum salsuginis TaxID=418750 RepID=A0A918K2G8_9GAMM|nr:hypothetical protein GCM10007392_05500 [Saccharospirillum salsuginis]